MTTSPPSIVRQSVNTVPEITLFFWIIKILATAVGEIGSDFLATTLEFWPQWHLDRNGHNFSHAVVRPNPLNEMQTMA
jgi:hypothetical protein